MPCPECKRIAGHSPICPLFKIENREATSSRGKLFDAVSILWALNREKSFITFTLPSIWNGTFQLDSQCTVTGDLAIGVKFSKTLEAWKKRQERKTGQRFSYVWVAEAQMKRQEKFGGVGDLHYHLVVNRKLKEDPKRGAPRGYFTKEGREEITWLQNNWCKQLDVPTAMNCIDVEPIPDFANSIPAYISKYLGKGHQRPILSRKFQATQDLTKYKTIQLSALPDDLELIRENVHTTPDGFDIVTRYFNTQETLERYADLMKDEAKFKVSRTDKNFTQAAIINRAFNRQLAQTMPHLYPTDCPF